jgi:hypothetical protein
MRTESAAVDGTEPEDGGSPPVRSRVATVMADSDRSQPTMKAAPFAGALLQGGIDVIVILNALRALRA